MNNKSIKHWITKNATGSQMNDRRVLFHEVNELIRMDPKKKTSNFKDWSKLKFGLGLRTKKFEILVTPECERA